MHHEKTAEDNNSNTQWFSLRYSRRKLLLLVRPMIKHVTEGRTKGMSWDMTKMWIAGLKEKVLKVLIQCFTY